MIRFITLFAAGLLAVCVLSLPSRACPPRYAYHANTVVVKEVVTPVIATVFAPVLVPAYGVSYGPGYSVPPAVASASPCDQAIGALRQEIAVLRQQVQPLPAPGAAPPPAVPPAAAAPSGKPGDGLAVLAAKCASCHESAVAASKGKGFVLLAGNQLVPLGDSQALKIWREVYSGRMPKNGQLTDEEVGKILALFDRKAE